MICDVCSSPISVPIEGLFALPTVTSDCRPWTRGRSVQICSGCGVMKRVTNSKFNHAVYDGYKSYPEPEGRTAKILGFVKDKISSPKKVLDIGCGQGHGMRVMTDFFPEAKVFGYEPAIHADRPSDKFDLITLFHVLEHVEDIHEMLAYIKSSLTDGGHVLIQVPYAAMWPFDLILADHWWHFTQKSLLRLFGENGFRINYIGNDIIKKEITLLTDMGEAVESSITDDADVVIGWLLRYKTFLDTINENVAVYGTGPAAAWTGNILGDRVDCYIDNDESRCGKYFNGRIVFPPNVYKPHCPVVAPFPDWQLPLIKAKNPDLRFL